ncbi:MAG: hypothetical protein U0838_05130 [Chloroflexota bacterium]
MNAPTPPFLSAAWLRPAVASAYTLSVAPPVAVMTSTRSPLVDLAAPVLIVPDTVTRRPSTPSPIDAMATLPGVGETPAPFATRPPEASRSSVWP